MEAAQIILVFALLISAWTLGLYIASDKGNLLAFLRQPIIRWYKNLVNVPLFDHRLAEYQKKKITLDSERAKGRIDKAGYIMASEAIDKKRKALEQGQAQKVKRIDFWFYFFKPVITCAYCMPSLHGAILFWILEGFRSDTWHLWLLSSVCSILINTAIIDQIKSIK